MERRLSRDLLHFEIQLVQQVKWLTDNVHWLVGFAGLWTLGNGILHDVFVLIQRRPYDKELIRLLIDGHILIFGGIVYLLCFGALRNSVDLVLWICVANAMFLLGYCALIFKMLPSYGMILINAAVLAVLLLRRFSF